MKRLILIFLIIVPPGLLKLSAQRIITLKECYDQAMSVNALSKEKEAYTNISILKDKNLSKGWLPTLDAGGNILYNSSVVDMTDVLGSLPVPGIADLIKPLPHEQYKITLDINQVIYDGGAIEGARELESADLKVNQKQTEADLYRIKGQVNSYYFSILLLEKQKELLKNYLEIIGKKITSLESALKNGVILRSDLDVLNSERIKLQQQMNEAEIRRTSLIRVLTELTGININTESRLTLPALPAELSNELARPELQLFDLRKEQLSATLKVIDSKRMPKAFGFATLGYGNPPGNNFFKDEFAPYYIIGAGIKWNIFDWNRSKNERQIVNYQQGIIDNRKSDLTDNLKRMLETKKAEISSLETLIKTDDELIELRKRITLTAESQYNNGTITATEYMNEMNSERQAVINYEIHKINLSMAKIEYMNISGKDIE